VRAARRLDPMHVLVTGGGGYIGLELCRQLLDRGDRVRVVDRFFFGAGPLEALALEHPGRVEIVTGDLRAWNDAWLDGVEGVSHLAGLSNDPTAEYNPDANWQMNAIGTERLGEACKRRKVRRFVFGSSASLYDGIGPGMFDERTPVAPVGAYSISKRYGEEALLRLAGEDFAPTILRQGTVYGYSPRMRFDLVVNTFVRDAITRQKLFLHGGGWQWRPLVDVSDVARAHLIVLDAPLDAVGGEIFNLMQENYQVRQLAMLVAGSLLLLGRTIQLEDAPLPKIVRDYRMTNLKMTQRTGFTPAVTVLESIDTMLKMLPIDDVAYLTNPRHNNIAWMTMLEETHAAQRPFASIY
jgi:nucleoside-diphosphate-sugar epimerase